MSESGKSNVNNTKKLSFKKPNHAFNKYKGKGGFQNHQPGNNPKNIAKPKWKGYCVELGEYTYFISDSRQADNYVKVTEAILNYLQRTYTHGSDVKTALEDGVDFDFEKVRPCGTGDIKVSSSLSEIDKLILQAEVKQFVDRKSKYCDNMNKVFVFIIGQ